VKISLDAGDSKESDELDKNMPTFEIFEKNPYCAFSVVIFWQFSEKIKNSFPASHLAFPTRFLLFAHV